MPGPFSEPIRELVAHELGTSSVEAHPDQTASGRDAAAVKAGFNPELIGFPSSAYAAVVFAAGSNLHLPSLPPPQAIESSHPNAVFDPMHGRVLTELEQRLRYTMEKRLSGLVGQNWIRHRVSEEARKRWLKRQKQDRDELGWAEFWHRTGTRLDWLPLRAVRRTGHLVRSWANLVPAIIQRSPAASYADGDGAGLRFSVPLGDSSVSSDRGDTVESTEANRERHDTGRNEERTGALAS